jgi:hypothetical protein
MLLVLNKVLSDGGGEVGAVAVAPACAGFVGDGQADAAWFAVAISFHPLPLVHHLCGLVGW